MRMSRIFPAMYSTSCWPSSRPMPSRTSRPRPISPTTTPAAGGVEASPTRTRAPVTRWTTARTSVLDLNQRRAFVFEPQRDAVAQLAARVQARVEEVARHDVAERLEHRLLDAGMLALEVEDQALDALPLQ